MSKGLLITVAVGDHSNKHLLVLASEILIFMVNVEKGHGYQSNYVQMISELYNSYCCNISVNLTTSQPIQLTRKDKAFFPFIASDVCSLFF